MATSSDIRLQLAARQQSFGDNGGERPMDQEKTRRSSEGHSARMTRFKPSNTQACSGLFASRHARTEGE